MADENPRDSNRSSRPWEKRPEAPGAPPEPSASPAASQSEEVVFFETEIDPKPPTPPALIITIPRGGRAGTFRSPDALRIGIVGGKGAGKSYLFQSLVYRVSDLERRGCLAPFLRRSRPSVLTARSQSDEAEDLIVDDLLKLYAEWRTLPQTTFDDQCWYKLRFEINTGWFGQRGTPVDIDFFDASGEALAFRQARGMDGLDNDNDTHRIMEGVYESYAQATVMVFCLPAWAALPARGLTNEERDRRKVYLDHYNRVVHYYIDTRKRLNLRHPVRTILALTMADDPRADLETLRLPWLSPFLDRQTAWRYHARLEKAGHIAQYLDNARKVSQYLRERMRQTDDKAVRNAPGELDFGAGEPWIVALSAIDGQRLARADKAHDEHDLATLDELGTPHPAHVELPLLMALSERYNALM